MDTKSESKSVDTDLENATPETKYFKMMMEDNEIGRVATGDDADADSIIGGQTIASLMKDGKIASGVKDSNTAESYAESNEVNEPSQSTMSIVGYDDVSTIANDTVNETTKAFFTGNGSREDSKPRIRLFKEYKNAYKTPEKKKRGGDQIDDDEQTQPETPPGMIQVPASQRSNSTRNKEELNADDKIFFLRSRQRIYLVAGVLALVLFIAIIALAVALRGVRGTESSESASPQSPSPSSDFSPENNEGDILDVWPDLDSVVGNNEKPSVKPVQEPTLTPVRGPTPEPTVDETAEIMFGEALSLLIEREIVSSEKEMERRPDSPQYKSTVWLSQDPNFYDYSEDRLIQRWSLAVLAQSLDPTFVVSNSLRARQLQGVSGSDVLPGWMTYTDECGWFSSRTTKSPCDQDGMYQTLDLQETMLGGTLPTELALLSNSLQHILLDGNGLTGSIPRELENLSNLVSLRLRRNNLEEGLSIDFGKLVNLEILDVGRNKLVGSVLYNILDLNSPTEIYLDYNELRGDIPWNIGELNTLTALALNDNSFTGWVPESLADLDDLKILTLGNNNLKGSLSKDVCKLKDLKTLSVDCVAQGCECCTECATTGSPTSNPTVEPTRSPTSSPTASPTKLPTASPTAVPTSFPTRTPTSFPTSSPSAAPIIQVPTSSPSECVAEMSILDFCFAPSANIGITLSNCYARQDDWVGIYRVDQTFDKNNLAEEPELWSWACGTRNCNEPVDQKTIAVSNIHGNNDKWPLQPGLYSAVLVRNTKAPYVAYAVSDTFVVAAQC